MHFRLKTFFCLLSLTAKTILANVVLDDPKHRGDRTYLFFKTGSNLERYACPIDVPTPSPSTCTLEPVNRLTASSVYDSVVRRVSKPLKNLDKTASLLEAEIGATDAKIDIILNSGGPNTPPENPELQAIEKKLAKARSHLTDVAVTIQDLSTQHDALEARLVTEQNSTLLKELLDIRHRLAKARSDHEEVLLEVLTLRSAYVKLASESPSNTALHALRGHRELQSIAYKGKIQEIQELLTRLTYVNKFIHELVNDESFTYVIPGEQLGSERYPFTEAANFCADYDRVLSELPAILPGPFNFSNLSKGPLISRSAHAAASVGKKIVIWGGLGKDSKLRDDGAIYDAGLGTWTKLPASPLAARYGHSAAAVGNKVVFWGGFVDGMRGYRSDGAVFDLDTAKWTMLPPSPLRPRKFHTSVGIGTKLIILGGIDRHEISDGASFDFATGDWSMLPRVPLPGFYFQTAAAVGTKMLVWGVGLQDDDVASAAIYDTALGLWSQVPSMPITEVNAHASASVGTKVFIWGGNSSSPKVGGAIYDMATETWSTNIPDSHLAENRSNFTACALGTKVVILGGRMGDDPSMDGIVFDVATNKWLP